MKICPQLGQKKTKKNFHVNFIKMHKADIIPEFLDDEKLNKWTLQTLYRRNQRFQAISDIVVIQLEKNKKNQIIEQ
ncbi:unnamed protein product [Paramecium sonneborni]|uniref:Uncharacterized protein n=1 Tax=Paramecium sonneborni TaxID=65129 RepID=A0A8S1QZN8_9CILI|nr:unnamed protein product [Paramecium sonneborni]